MAFTRFPYDLRVISTQPPHDFGSQSR